MATLLIHVQPRASASAVIGWHGGAIKIRLAAPPVDGKANDSLIKFLAEALSVPSSTIRIVRGGAGRRKRIAVSSLSEEEALSRLGLSIGEASP